ncbi:hypothetical protein NDU88_000635 [Pleurodeles waltl]|uniref:Uncharacterized protein n=1 Tax=Pleurodeles waltl TaxID=8319 RepID=A0AAV7S7S1_PLEWA|nr:hypothetical protein NDU88_000635 [Pleurodeles waltl]
MFPTRVSATSCLRGTRPSTVPAASWQYFLALALSAAQSVSTPLVSVWLLLRPWSWFLCTIQRQGEGRTSRQKARHQAAAFSRSLPPGSRRQSLTPGRIPMAFSWSTVRSRLVHPIRVSAASQCLCRPAPHSESPACRGTLPLGLRGTCPPTAFDATRQQSPASDWSAT